MMPFYGGEYFSRGPDLKPEDKKDVRQFEKDNARIFHCMVCKATGVTLFCRINRPGYVCRNHREFKEESA